MKGKVMCSISCTIFASSHVIEGRNVSVSLLCFSSPSHLGVLCIICSFMISIWHRKACSHSFVCDNANIMQPSLRCDVMLHRLSRYVQMSTVKLQSMSRNKCVYVMVVFSHLPRHASFTKYLLHLRAFTKYLLHRSAATRKSYKFPFHLFQLSVHKCSLFFFQQKWQPLGRSL